MKFRSALKKNLFTLLFIAGEMIWKFVSGVIAMKRLVYICKQTWARFKNMHVESNSPEVLRSINTSINKNSKF